MGHPDPPFDPSRTWPAVLDEVTGALAALTEFLDTEEDLYDLLGRVCDQVTRAVPGVDAATVTLLRHGEPHTAASTGEVATRLDLRQYDLGAGPCLTAAEHGVVIRATLQDATRLWPAFADEASRAGMGSFLSAPLVLGDGHAGGINCYSAHGHGFAELDERLLDLYTTAVEAALRGHQRYLSAQRAVDQLRTALDSRSVIDQAKGMLMAIRSVSAEEAFRLLVARSQQENVKLRQVAERFVADVARRTE